MSARYYKLEIIENGWILTYSFLGEYIKEFFPTIFDVTKFIEAHEKEYFKKDQSQVEES